MARKARGSLEEENDKLRDELWKVRQIVVGMAPENMRELLTSYYDCKTREDVHKWQLALIENVLKCASPKPPREMAEFDSSTDRAYCPLCAGSSDNIYGTKGFAFPDGLRRHLEGSYSARQCEIVETAIALARDHVSDPTSLKLGPVK